MERSRRLKSGRRSQVSDAIARLKEEREGGVGTRAKSYESRQENRVYDVVDEDEYTRMVQEKNKSGGSFVVDDDGLGYKDDEGEDWFGSEVLTAVGRIPDESKSCRGDAPSTKNVPSHVKRKPLRPPEVKAKKKMQQMFLRASAKKDHGEKTSVASSDALLESILTGIEDPSLPSVSDKTPSRSLSGIVEQDTVPHLNQKGFSLASIPTTQLSPDQEENKSQDDFTFDTPVRVTKDEDCSGGLMALANLADDTGPASPKFEIEMPTTFSNSQEESPQRFQTPASPTSIPDVQMLSIKDDPPDKETSSNTQAQSFLPPKPRSFAPVSGWENIQKSEDMMDSAENIAWEDDGVLPLSDGETLPFYLMDALEDYSSSGSILLFGKIPSKASSRTMSCCAVLRDVDRVLFFVPTPGIFGPHEHEIAQMEAKAVQNPETHLDLMKYLQQLAEPVKAEVRGKLLALGVKKIRMKPVKRKYAFEEEAVPHGEQYVIKVSCPSTVPLSQSGMQGNTFTHVFGLNQSNLELFLLKRKIMGPSWIGLIRPTKKEARMQRSWCSVEVEVFGHKSVIFGRNKEWSLKSAPLCTVASINVKTFLNPNTQANEIVAVSVVYVEEVKTEGPTEKSDWNGKIKHFSGITKLRSQPWPAGIENMVSQVNSSPAGKRNGGNILKTLPSERSLLNYFLARLKMLDPDVLVGHNIAAFDLQLLFHRMNQNKVDEWSRIGRLKRQKYPSFAGGGQVFGGGAGPSMIAALAGRLLCDTYISSRELVKEVDYTLTTLSKSLLGEFRNSLAVTDVPKLFDSLEGLSTLVQHTESDAYLSMGIMFHLSVLPLSKQLTNLSGSLWNRTLQGQRAQRIEMLLLHEFHARKYLLPDKLSAKERAAKSRHQEDAEAEGDVPARSKRKAQYAGGLVLEPKKGLYDKFVLLLDFNSLYPSIIQEYNICFTTVSRQRHESDHQEAAQLPEPSSNLAPLPSVIKNLVHKRRQAKAMMSSSKDAIHKQQLNIRQQALKLTANSMYGCLGFSTSRFFCKPLAELITAQGREILQSTVDLVQGRLGMEVVYGDTDSIMINTGKDCLEDVMQQGQAIKKEVNKHYRLLEIDIDGVFKSLLLLKKKKYAAMKVEVLENGQIKEEMEQKGLDLVRRDWCPLSKVVGNFALKEILSGKLKEEVVMAIHEHLREVQSKVEAGEYDLSQYVITKQLTKAPDDYPDANSQAHVQVALRRKKEGKRDGVAQGETVPYVICIPKDADNVQLDTKSLASRAFHPDEVTDHQMEIDKMYYLGQQVHPSVSRLCAPIEGTDQARLADCLGLDASKYRHLLQSDAKEASLSSTTGFMDDEDNFKDYDPLYLTSNSGDRFAFCGVDGILKGSVAALDALGPPHAAGDDSQRLSGARFSNQAALAARRMIRQYYDGWIRTDEENHSLDSRDICIKSHHENPGRRIVTEKDLYMQLKHLHRVTDVKGACRRLNMDELAVRKTVGEDTGQVLAQASREIKWIRDGCEFRWVSMDNIFGETSPGIRNCQGS